MGQEASVQRQMGEVEDIVIVLLKDCDLISCGEWWCVLGLEPLELKLLVVVEARGE